MTQSTDQPPLSPADARHIDRTCDRFEGVWKAGQQPAINQEPPDLLEGHPADELLDIDPSIPQ